MLLQEKIIVLPLEDGNPKVSANRVTGELKMLFPNVRLPIFAPLRNIHKLHPLKKSLPGAIKLCTLQTPLFAMFSVKSVQLFSRKVKVEVFLTKL